MADTYPLGFYRTVDVTVGKVIFESEGPYPHYSTDPHYIEEIIVRMSFDYAFELFYYPGISSFGWGFVATFKSALHPYNINDWRHDPDIISYNSTSMPLAVCLAALKAKGVAVSK